MNRTPTQTLIDVMESFGEDEPLEAMVLYITKGGDFCWSCTDNKLSTKLGLLASAKYHILRSYNES